MLKLILPSHTVEEHRSMSEEQQAADRIDMARLYDETAARWSRDEPQVRDDLITWPLIVSLSKRYAGNGVILDCGCGTGNICRLLSPFAKSVIGIDVSANMIAEAERHTPAPSNIIYVRGDMRCLDEHIPPASVNLALSIFGFCCLESVEDLKTTMKQMRTVLADDGMAIIQIPHPLEGFFKLPSEWLQEVDPVSNYFASGIPLRRKLKALNGDWLLVARHHFTLSNYVEAIVEGGFKINQVIEPVPSRAILREHPSLQRESVLPSSMIFVLQRAS